MYGKTSILENVKLTDGSHQVCKFQCLNCNAKIQKQYRYKDKLHRCSSFRDNEGLKEKWCFKCKNWLELAFFQKAKHVHGGYSKACRGCRQSYMNRAEKTRKVKNRQFYDQTGNLPNIKFHQILNTAKNRASKNNLSFNLDLDHLKLLWLTQKGLCYYSSFPMKWAKQKVSFHSPSLDKLDPNKGYVKGNVVFCLFAVNSFKQELTATDFLQFVHSVKWKTKD